MNNSNIFDKETYANEQLVARQIVQEIQTFGVTQQQLLRICYLLSLELENNNAMQKISSCIHEYLHNIANEENDDDNINNENAIITNF